MSDATPIDQPGRRCPNCKIVKPADEFYSGKHGRGKGCRKCYRAYMAELIRPRVEFLNGYKTERGCADCGWNGHPAVLEFDHRPDEVKVQDVSIFKHKGSWRQMVEEVAKCDVVCANCHRLRTIERRDSGRNQGWDLRKRASEPPTVIERYSADPDQLDLFDETA